MNELITEYPLQSYLNPENNYVFYISASRLGGSMQIEPLSEKHIVYEKNIPSIAGNYSPSHIRHTPWISFSSPLESFTTQPLSPSHALTALDITQFTERSLEIDVIKKYRKFNEVLKIYLDHQTEALTNVKVILDTDHYDYELMDRIFKEGEFPIKDSFPGLLIHFDYIPPTVSSYDLINQETDRLIYNKANDQELEYQWRYPSFALEPL